MTLYAPDRRIPLHPPVLSEGAASLLPDQVRPALLWTHHARRARQDDRRRRRPGSGAQPRAAELRPGPGRDRRRLAPGDARPARRARAVAGTAGAGSRRGQPADPGAGDRPDEPVAGRAGRLAARVPGSAAGRGLERADLPAHRDGGRAHHALRPDGHPANACRRPITGRCAGCTRPPRRCVSPGRRSWTTRSSCAALDPYKPDEAAMLNACTTLFRGAGYQAFSGGVPRRRACGAGHRLRPRDRAAAPAGRPLCRGDLCRAVRRPAGAELGAARAGRVARGDGGGRAARQAVRAGDHRPGRGVPAAVPGGRDVHRHRGRRRA